MSISRWNDLIKYFGENKPFSFKDLHNYYENLENKILNMSTTYKRIYRLKKKDKIRSIGSGTYIIDYKKDFKPLITENMKEIYYLITNEVCTEICMWDTQWLHNFMVHQPITSILILEVDRFLMETVYSLIKENSEIEHFKGIYIYPKEKEIFQYILGTNSIVILPIIKEAQSTLNKLKNILTPKIEKILVDLFFYEKLLTAYRGNELKNIYEEVFKKYKVNVTTLLRYARNRGIKNKLIKFILNTNIDSKYINIGDKNDIR